MIKKALLLLFLFTNISIAETVISGPSNCTNSSCETEERSMAVSSPTLYLLDNGQVLTSEAQAQLATNPSQKDLAAIANRINSDSASVEKAIKGLFADGETIDLDSIQDRIQSAE